MMSKPIKVGDLVMVVRPTACCQHPGKIGKIYVVTEIFFSKGSFCERCKLVTKDLIVAVDGSRFINEDGTGGGYPVSRLIRIDPPAQDEETRTDQEVAA